MYIIPKIKWTVHDNQTWTARNTFIDYTIRKDREWYVCFYGNGRFKEFKSLSDAQEWVDTIHYPAQIEKYLIKV